jgi:UbiD family decarboxylase
VQTLNESVVNKPAVGYRDLRDYLDLLESRNLLRRVTSEVDPKHELGAIAARSLARKGPALRFEDIRGYAGKPLVTNVMSTTEQLAVVFNTDADEELIQQCVVAGMNSRIPSVEVPTGPCKEVIVRGDNIDVNVFPTPVWHELDGGAFIGTTAGIITRDPQSGQLNMGMYRVMILGGKALSVTGKLRSPNSSAGTGGPDHLLENWKNDRTSPIAIVLGMDPLLTLAAGSPVGPGEDGSMEYEAAAGWRGSPTEVVRCETNDLLVPARAEIIIEGVVPTKVRVEEGPHGESTGFYGESKDGFRIDITCITHRRDPISYGLICQRVEDYPRQLLRSASIQARIIQKTGLTNIREAYFPEVGRMGALIFSATIRDKDDPRRIMDGIWNDSGEPWRWIIVVDDDCNVRDWDDVMWRVVSNVEPARDVVMGKVHEAPRRRTTEVDFTPPTCGMGIDATFGFKGQDFPPTSIVGADLMKRVVARWKELGLD